MKASMPPPAVNLDDRHARTPPRAKTTRSDSEDVESYSEKEVNITMHGEDIVRKEKHSNVHLSGLWPRRVRYSRKDIHEVLMTELCHGDEAMATDLRT